MALNLIYFVYLHTLDLQINKMIWQQIKYKLTFG